MQAISWWCWECLFLKARSQMASETPTESTRSSYTIGYFVGWSSGGIWMVQQLHYLDSVLMDYEWKLLPWFLELLLPLKDEQKPLEKDKYVTISRVPFLVKCLMKHLDTFAKERQDLIGPFKPFKAWSKAMYLDFDNRWKCSGGLKYYTLSQKGAGNWIIGVCPIAFIASFLDPRWKLLALELSD